MGRSSLFSKLDVARRYDLTLPTIDSFVAEEILEPIYLNDGTFFRAGAFLRIEIILIGRKLGFSLSEIKQLIDAQSGLAAKDGL